MKGFLMNVESNKIAPVEFADVLEELYKLLNVDRIDIVVRKIGRFFYDIVCDDEGFLKEEIIPSAINRFNKIQLVGNLLLCQHDEEGGLQGLTEEQIKNVKENLVIARDSNGKEYPMVLVEV